jgi:hypothetical protein
LAISTSLLAPAAGRANPVQVENAQPGDAGWSQGLDPSTQAPTPGAGIEGYTSEPSAAPGERVDFHVRSAARYRVEIYRLGWYGGVGGRRLACLPSCSTDDPPAPQFAPPPPDPITGMVRAGWSVTDGLTVPDDWVSGYYIANFVVTSGPYAGKARWHPFVVRAPSDRPASIRVTVPVNTWYAYNSWGGKSLYDYNSSGRKPATQVSLDRPLRDHNNPVFGWEYQVVRFLERSGYDVSYVTDVDVDRDPSVLQRRPPGLPAGKGMVLAAGHGEYWSKNIHDAYDSARDAGTNLAFLGADTADWQLRYEDGDHTLVEYRSALSDPEPNPALKTVRFKDLIPSRPQCRLLGVSFKGGVRSYPQNPPQPFTVTVAGAADPWLAGTGLYPGDQLDEGVGYEWDATDATCANATVQSLLHFSDTNSGGTARDADAVRYTPSPGVSVFTSGSLQFAWKLDGWREPGFASTATPWGADPRVQQLMRNVVDDMAGGPPTTSLDTSASDPSNDPSAAFTFSSNDDAANFECRVDGSPWSACTSPSVPGGVQDGPHTFAVRALDAVGTYDETPAESSWTLDTMAPTLSISDCPSGRVVIGDAVTVAATAGDDGTGLADDGDPSGAHSLDTATPGTHSLTLSARDRAGNVTTRGCDYTVVSRYVNGVESAPGLVAYWRLGERSGTSAFDITNVTNGLYDGPVTLGVPGAIPDDTDTAARFDGAGRVVLGDLGSASDFTIEGWERLRSSSTTDPVNGNNTLYGGPYRLRLLPRPGGAYAGVSFGDTEYRVGPNTAWNVGSWVHWAMVRAGARLSLYRNGQLAGERTDLPSDQVTLGGYIGAYGSQYRARADIDEVAVYRRALSADEVQAQVAAASAPTTVPGAPATDRQANTGWFRLTWSPAYSAVGALTYTLEREPEGAADDWTTVAAGIPQTSFAFGIRTDPEAAGAWRYRVRAVVSGKADALSDPSATVQVDAAAPSGYRDAIVATPGLISYWRLGEGSGPAAFDIADVTDGAYDGAVTLGVPGAIPDDTDTAARFDGAGRVVLGDLGIATDFTVEGWERLRSNSTTDPVNGNNTLFGGPYRLRLLPRPRGAFAGVSFDETEYRVGPSTASNVDTWVHWAMVRAGPRLSLYRDGQLVGERTDLPAGPVMLGGYIGAYRSEYYARADIDDVAVYRRALSADEVQAHYAAH